MENERAIEILDPEHREAYESLEPVNEACRMGVEALRRRVGTSRISRRTGRRKTAGTSAPAAGGRSSWKRSIRVRSTMTTVCANSAKRRATTD